jgi:hypothetical protein
MEPIAIIEAALRYKPKDEFILSAIDRIEQTVTLTAPQIVGLKYVGRLANDMAIQEIVGYIQAGTWQEVGLEAIISEALTEAQRTQILDCIVQVAREEIESQIAAMQQILA